MLFYDEITVTVNHTKHKFKLVLMNIIRMKQQKARTRSVELEFEVTVFYGPRWRTVSVTEEVSDEEYDLLEECRRADEDIDGFSTDLYDLCDRLHAAALNQVDLPIFARGGLFFDEEQLEVTIDRFSTAVKKGGKADEKESGNRDEYYRELLREASRSNDFTELAFEDDIYARPYERYMGYPFAMEDEYGQVVSMTKAFKLRVLRRLLDECSMTERELADYLRARLHFARPAETCDLLERYDSELLAYIFGFKEGDLSFKPDATGFLRYRNGWGILSLLRDLGFYIQVSYYSEKPGGPAMAFYYYRD